jgi:hypothetical protein
MFKIKKDLMNLKRLILYVSLIFIFLILFNKIISIFLNFENFINLNELFINYEGGFLRRGLFGQIAFFLFSNFNINPITFFSILFSLANFIFFILYILCIQKFKNNFFLYLILIFSPATLMFSIFDSVNFFNNQIFLLISILLHVYLATKYKKRIKIYKNFLYFLIIPFLFLSILQYDPQILTLSVHFYITYFVSSKNKIYSKNIYYPYLILLIPIFLIILNNGSVEQVIALENMKNIVRENYDFIISKHPESFSMIETNDLGGNLNLKLGALIKIFGIYFGYQQKKYIILSILLSIVIFILIAIYFVEKKIYLLPTKFFTIFLFILPIFSLFIFITDYGRTIHIFLLHILAIFFLFEINNKKKLLEKKKSLFKESLIIIFLFIYCNFWTLSHAAGWVTIFNPNQPKYSVYSSYFNEIKKISFNAYYFTDKFIIELPKAEFMMPYLNK